jgi:hypothetical protein
VIYLCCDERRRSAIRGFAGLNGIDFLEVVDSDATSTAERQRRLRVHFLKSPAPPAIRPANVQISGGERIRNITADTVSYDGDVLVVHVDRAGDFSTYRLRLVAVDAQGIPWTSRWPDSTFSWQRSISLSKPNARPISIARRRQHVASRSARFRRSTTSPRTMRASVS